MRIRTDSGRVKNVVSVYDKTVKARLFGIVLKNRRPFFYSGTATFRMTDGNYTKETFAAERRKIPKSLTKYPQKQQRERYP